MIQSTNLCLNTPAFDLTRLNNEYQLVKYSFPTYRFRSKNDITLHKRLIIAYKRKLDHPFYFFTQNRPSAAFYVLYRRTELPIILAFDEINESAEPIPVPFEDLLYFNPESGKNDKLHILVKVLVASYFWNESEQERRICQSDFYILGKRHPKKEHKIVGVGLELKHYQTLPNGQDEFCLVIGAENFVKHQVDKELKLNTQSYYEELIKDGVTYYRQLNPLKVKDIVKPVWQLEQKSISNKASLEWHLSGNRKSETRGYVAYQFQQRFVAYLNELIGGEAKVASGKIYKEQKFESKSKKYKDIGKGDTGLPIRMLGTVCVLDNRLRTMSNGDLPINSVPFQDYIDFLNGTFSKKLLVTFRPVNRESLSEADFNEPVLILQDVDKKLFGSREIRNDNGEVERRPNPLSNEGYEDPKTELYEMLRHLPKQTLSINPNSAFDFKGKFVHQTNYLTYFDYELFAPKTVKYQLPISLNELYLKNLLIKKLPLIDTKANHYFPCFRERPELALYAFLHNNHFLYINDEKQVQIIDVRLPANRNTMKNLLATRNVNFQNVTILFDEKYYLYEAGNDKQQKARTTKWKNARLIFAPNMCAEIEEPDERVFFPYDRSDKGVLWTGKLSPVQTDRGIVGIYYIPDENRYIVGHHKNPAYSGLDRATKVRRFHVYQGADVFDADTILETMSVKFVRNEQYTVYPFFFDLINLHCENMGVD